MNSNLRIALILAGLISVWMLSGLVAKDETSQNSIDEQQAFSVRALESRAQDYRRPIYIRGRTQAERSVNVAAETDGLVEKTPAAEGQWVERGAVLCELRKEDRLLRVAQAKAQLDKAQIDYDAALKLKDSGYQSRSQIAASKVNLALARAELERNQNVLERLQVRAPFAGVLERRYTEQGDFITRGSPCATLLELNPLIVVGEVSERDISALSIGDEAQVRFVNGELRVGRVRYLGHQARELTRTFKVEIELDNSDHSLVSGLTADVQVNAESVQAHLLSPALLTLLDKGSLGLRSVDKDNRVQVHEVQLLADSQDGVWVTGLPESLRLITVGQDYVSEGELVTVVESDSGSGSNAEAARNSDRDGGSE
ncbi:efflux RND transporter periplasmic adaptor subunit [Agaribacterium haliotis]|uniref:efflux RND transporter periplasmic adaptor subunit n=1 Tax=Agaribacterium haliotis TaxID=2013869 RepID=UPI001304697F|nr:efflux RND transporter periplasmic adaptor subunit [Agaribacterium haliotis]